MSAAAPVCHIPPVTTTQQPTPVNIPAIPPAGPSIASLVASVNALRLAVLLLTNQHPQPPDNGTTNGFKLKNDPKGSSRWSEQSRVTETVRVFNPDDHSQFVDVERINKLSMRDNVTGEAWSWDRERK